MLINFSLNIHNVQAALIRINSAMDLTKFRSLLAADEFTSEFFTMVCWLFILSRVHHLVASLGQYLQFLFAVMGILISFHTFHTVAYVNEYLCNFSYLLMLLTLFHHSSKEHTNQLNPSIKPLWRDIWFESLQSMLYLKIQCISNYQLVLTLTIPEFYKIIMIKYSNFDCIFLRRY